MTLEAYLIDDSQGNCFRAPPLMRGLISDAFVDGYKPQHVSLEHTPDSTPVGGSSGSGDNSVSGVVLGVISLIGVAVFALNRRQ
jgi:hypothetical protein